MEKYFKYKAKYLKMKGGMSLDEINDCIRGYHEKKDALNALNAKFDRLLRRRMELNNLLSELRAELSAVKELALKEKSLSLTTKMKLENLEYQYNTASRELESFPALMDPIIHERDELSAAISDIESRPEIMMIIEKNKEIEKLTNMVRNCTNEVGYLANVFSIDPAKSPLNEGVGRYKGPSLFVKLLSGKTLSLKYDSSMTGAMVRFIVSIYTQNPPEKIKLRHVDKELNYERSLSDEGVYNESTLHMILLLK